jgi:hypothetical protein
MREGAPSRRSASLRDENGRRMVVRNGFHKTANVLAALPKSVHLRIAERQR